MPEAEDEEEEDDSVVSLALPALGMAWVWMPELLVQCWLTSSAVSWVLVMVMSAHYRRSSGHLRF